MRAGDHLPQDVGRRGVGLDVVGGREEEALERAVGVGRQAQGGRVRRGGLELLDRLAGLLGEPRQRPLRR